MTDETPKETRLDFTAVFEAELDEALTSIFAALAADGTYLANGDKEGIREDALAYYAKQPKKWSGLDVVVDTAVPAGYAELRDTDGNVVVTLKLDGRHLAIAPDSEP